MKYRALAVTALLAVSIPVFSQDFAISTVAGGVPPLTPLAAVDASIGDPPRVATDAAGNLYFASLHSVFKVDPAGTLTRIAGTGRYGYSGDGGRAVDAQLAFPEGIAIDKSGSVYVADRDANVIRQITAAGKIVTFAGTGAAGYSGDGGPAAQAAFDGITGLALDAAGNLYVADTGNSVIRRITPDGTISTIAGTGQRGFDGDGGPAAAAVLNGPEGVAADAAGNLYIADTFNHRVRQIAPDGTITTLAGTGLPGCCGDDGPAAAGVLMLPVDVAADTQGRVFVADFGNSRIRMIDGGTIATVAGSARGIPPVDGQLAVSVRFGGPTGVAVDSAGNIYFTNSSTGSGSGLAKGDFKIWKVGPDALLTHVAGNGFGNFSGDGGAASFAQLNAPTGVALDAAGNVYFADTGNNRVRRIALDGSISTVAGFGDAGFSGDGGPAVSALLDHPLSVAIDGNGNLLIADTGNNRIRLMYPDGTIGTVAGNGNAALFGDGGDALAAALHAPRGVAVDKAGVIYIADTGDNRVRRVINGVIDSIAGGGPDAPLKAPSALAVDAAGNVYVADEGNGAVRKLSPGGTLSIVAGPDSGLAAPRGLAFGPAGELYVADGRANRIFRVTPSGAVTPIAGTGDCCYADGTSAANALLNAPWGIAADPSGNIFFADTGNDAIRFLKPPPAAAPSVRR